MKSKKHDRRSRLLKKNKNHQDQTSCSALTYSYHTHAASTLHNPADLICQKKIGAVSQSYSNLELWDSEIGDWEPIPGVFHQEERGRRAWRFASTRPIPANPGVARVSPPRSPERAAFRRSRTEPNRTTPLAQFCLFFFLHINGGRMQSLSIWPL